MIIQNHSKSQIYCLIIKIIIELDERISENEKVFL